MTSLACQSASATRPTATSHSRNLPKGWLASVFSAPEVSALLLSDALHAICTANQPMRRCTTP
jgi:hypothetical protein